MSAGHYVGLLAVLFFNAWAWSSLCIVAGLAGCGPLVWLSAVMAIASGVGVGVHVVEGFR